MSDIVFVSYSRQDTAKVLPVVERLRARDVSIWFDQSSIPASVPWFEEIEHAIRSAVLVVFFDSNGWRSSASCCSEAEIATRLLKFTLTVPVPDHNGTEAAVRAIVDAVSQVGAVERARARLLASSQRWVRAGRRAADLASKSTLAVYRAVPQPVIEVDAASVDFLRRSRRRLRWRRTLAALAAVTTIALYVLGWGVKRISDMTSQLVTKRIDQLSAQAAVESSTRANAYAGLVSALAATTKDDNFPNRQILTTALNYNVPISARAARAGDWRVAPPLAEGTQARRGEIVATVFGAPARVEIANAEGLLRTIPVNGEAQAISWDNVSGRLALADGGGIHILDTNTTRELTTLRGADGCVATIDWLDRNTVVGRSTGGAAATWKVVQATVLAETGYWFMDMAAAPDGSSFAAVSRDGQMLLFAEGGISKRISLGPGEVTRGVAWTPRGWAVSRGAAVIILKNDGAQEIYPLEDCQAGALSWNSLAGRLAITCVGQSYAELNLDLGDLRRTRVSVFPESLAISADGTTYLGGELGEIDEVSPRGAESLFRKYSAGCPYSARVVRVSSNGNMVANAGSGMYGMCLQISRRVGGAWQSQPFVAPRSDLNDSRASAFSHDGSKYAIGFLNGVVWVVDPVNAETRVLVSVAGSEIRGLAFTGDDSSLMVITRDGELLGVPLREAQMSIGDMRSLLQGRIRIGAAAYLAVIPPVD